MKLRLGGALCVLGFAAAAQTLADSARELGRGIAAAAGSEAVSLAVRNASSLAPGEAAQVQAALEAALRRGPGGVEASVTLSENLRGYVWVAEIRKGESREVVIVERARPAPNARGPVETTVSLTHRLLWEQAEPILDAAVLDDTLVLLDPARLSFFNRRGDGWEPAQSLPVAPLRPWPRDVRGRLSIDRGSLRAHLPGTVCAGNVRPPAIECRAADAVWPVEPSGSRLAASRNHFTSPKLPAFFSAGRAGGQWIVAGLDGRVRLYTDAFQPAGTLLELGSDLALVETPCGRFVLATKPAGAGEPDSVQAFAVSDGGAAPASPPVAFHGPVTVLWPAGAGAIAVSRDNSSGKYAAYSVSVGCGR